MNVWNVYPVLHIFESSGSKSTGGVDTYIEIIQKYWQKKDKNAVMFLVIHNDEFTNILKNIGFKVFSISEERSLYKKSIRYLRALINEIVKYQIKTIHSHGYKADYIGYLLKKKLTAKKREPIWIVHCHGWINTGLINKFQTWIDIKLLRGVDGIVIVCDYMRRILLANKIDEDKIYVIKNVVKPKKRSVKKAASQYRRIIGVGRLSPEKRWDLFIEMVGRLRHLEYVEFIIYGEGKLKEPLQQQINRLGLSKKVKLAGYVREKEILYDNADIMVICSDTEGIPFVLLEAMERGIAVIATRVGGIPEIITDSENGLLVDVGNCEKMADSLERLLMDDILRANIIDNARKYLDNMSSNHNLVLELEQVYLKVSKLKFKSGGYT
ncbi:MAG: glycosyltransferase family 4 protein [Lachnospiraceae bacterium]|nr:glycosyltransferase family 4 protein [Lachnospiraceae bacterium]